MGSPIMRPFKGYGVIRAIRNAGLLTILSIGGAHAEPVVVAALGDSLTQGYGLAPNDGFVPQLQSWLDARGADAVVINAGVSGDTTAGGASRIAWTLTNEVDAVVVALGGNDLLRGIDPDVSRQNLDRILAEVHGRDLPALLVGMDAPSNYGASYEAKFEAMYPELAKKYSALHHPNFLGALAALEDRATVLETYMQPDRIHPNTAGVSLIVEDLGPSILALIDRVM